MPDGGPVFDCVFVIGQRPDLDPVSALNIFPLSSQRTGNPQKPNKEARPVAPVMAPANKREGPARVPDLP